MEPSRPFDNPDVGYMITNISYGIRQYFDNLFSDYDVTYPQSRVLTRLFGQLGSGNQGLQRLLPGAEPGEQGLYHLRATSGGYPEQAGHAHRQGHGTAADAG